MLIPGIGLQLARQRRIGQPPNGLTLLRYMYVAFVNAMILIGFVVIILATMAAIGTDGISVALVAGVVALVGLLALLIEPSVERPLDCTDDTTLIASYRARFFLRIAFAEAPVLAGFAGFLITDRWWIYAIGAALGAIGYMRLAPTRAHLARDQEAIAQAGCTRSLIAALAGPQPGKS